MSDKQKKVQEVSNSERFWRMLFVLGAVLVTANLSLNLRTLYFTWF